jgi:hypothetical protein
MKKMAKAKVLILLSAKTCLAFSLARMFHPLSTLVKRISVIFGD